MDDQHHEIEKIFKAKAARRKALARLPIEEKVKILIELQNMAAPLLRVRSRDVRIRELDDSEKD